MSPVTDDRDRFFLLRFLRHLMNTTALAWTQYLIQIIMPEKDKSKFQIQIQQCILQFLHSHTYFFQPNL